MIKFNKEDIFIVTGASSGIGQAAAQKLNELGAGIIAVARSVEKLEQTKLNSKHTENIFIEPKDLTENIEELPDYVKSLKEKYGQLRGLVCCAGTVNPKPLQMIEEKISKEIFDINYFAPIFLAKGFSDKRNRRLNSSIVFIASTAGVYPDKGQTIYAASKAALIASMKSISKELASKGVRVNSISPAYVETPMFYRTQENIGTDVKTFPLGIGKPSDLADMTAFLLSDEARWITGQNYIMDGGAF